MPVFEIANRSLALDYMGLEAISLWPRNKARREEFMRSLFARMDVIAEEEPGPVPYQLWRIHARPLAEALGGRMLISEAPGMKYMIKEAEGIIGHAAWAGIAFLRIYQLANQCGMPELATLNRIAYLIEKKEDRPRSSFLKTWKEFKSVAHIWAAMLVAGGFGADDSSEDEPTPPDGRDALDREMESTFAWALEFQRFGREFTPANGKAPMLNQDESWIIEGSCPWERCPLPAVGAEEFAILQNYQAPKTF